MAESQADIIAIQEVQIGTHTTGEIGSPISPEIVTLLERIRELLDTNDPGAGWALMVSGINNSDRAKSMSDAYAFFWKRHPASSRAAHDSPAVQISCLQSPVIIRREGTDLLGRRPGMIVFDVTGKPDDLPIPFKVISWHAPTPCNQIAKSGASSGRGIIDLGSIPAVGGVVMVDRTGGHAPRKPEPGAPLPCIDTIVLGDMNYDMSASGASIVYHNLVTNYQPCISTPDHVLKTTYSSNPAEPFRNPSSYDNIFSLKPHDKFVPSLVPTGARGVIDFIHAEAQALGEAAEISFFPTATAWYVIFQDLYKRQYSKSGVSDHLPVWADFKIGEGTPAGTSNAKPTSGADNNCAFHATLGAPDARGVYVDPAAGAHRNALADWIAGAAANNARLAAIQDNLIATWLDVFAGNPQVVAALQQYLQPGAPLLNDLPGFDELMAAYIAILRTDRMLTWHELTMLAQERGITIRLWNSNSGVYRSRDLNPGNAVTDVYHFGVHFFRYIPN